MTPFKPKIIQFALAIQSFEGYFAPCLRYPLGTAAWRNNNPGNMKYGPYAKAQGAYRSSPMGFAVFQNYQQGLNALCQFLTDACSGKLPIYHPELGLEAFFRVYAPSNDNNNPDHYATVISQRLKVTLTTPIKNLIV